MTGATLYDADVDLTLDEMLADAVPPPVCEFRLRDTDPPCGVPATWMLAISCGHSIYYDDEHRTLVDGNLARPGQPELCALPWPPHHPSHIRVTHQWIEVPR